MVATREQHEKRSKRSTVPALGVEKRTSKLAKSDSRTEARGLEQKSPTAQNLYNLQKQGSGRMGAHDAEMAELNRGIPSGDSK